MGVAEEEEMDAGPQTIESAARAAGRSAARRRRAVGVIVAV